MARRRAVAPRWVSLASPAQRPLAAAARAVKPPPPESMTAAAVVDARCGGSQRTPQRPQQQHRQWKPRQQRRQRQRQCSSVISVISVIISSSGSSDGSSSSFSTVGRRRMPATATCMNTFFSRGRSAWRKVGVTAVCLGGPPSADLGRRRLFEPEGVLIQTELEPRARHALRLHTNSCASCASAVFAISTTLIAPRSSHRTRPVPLSSLRAHPSALIALCVTAVHL